MNLPKVTIFLRDDILICYYFKIEGEEFFFVRTNFTDSYSIRKKIFSKTSILYEKLFKNEKFHKPHFI